MYSSIPFLVYDTVCLARRVDSGDGDDGFIGIPPLLSALTGEHPKTQVQAWDFLALFRLVNPPLRSEKSLIFPNAFSGCNTLHLASKVVCQMFPLDSLLTRLRLVLSYAFRFG